MLRLTLYECVVKICIQGWFLIRNWIFGRIICRTMKNKDVNAIEPRKAKGAKKIQGSQLQIELLHYLHVHSRTLIATEQRLRVHLPCMLIGTTQASKECGQIREKNTVNSQEYC